MQKFTVDTAFIFKGTFTVPAETREEAREIVMKHCGLVLGGDIHTTHPDVDWDFRVHPEKKIIYVCKE